MRYRANPVTVDAYRITHVDPPLSNGNTELVLENGNVVFVRPELLARVTPVAGDYFVIQDDGYTYLNPKDVFERKYSPLEEVEAVLRETVDEA